jgi:hypothetical protein
MKEEICLADESIQKFNEIAGLEFVEFQRLPCFMFLSKGRDEHDPLRTLVNGMIVY